VLLSYATFVVVRDLYLIRPCLGWIAIMSEAMKTHVPAQYFSHVPRQWKLKTTHSVRAQEKDDVEMNY
jgi:hypothetical protein